MSEAVVWAKAQTVGNALAKDVLKTLASWADGDGFVWSPISVMAFEIERSERTVQRGLAYLLALENPPIELTARKHLREGKLLPVYRLQLDRGPRNTREALRVEREKVELGVTPVSPQKIWGDATVTGRGDNPGMLGVTPVSPHHLKGKEEEESKPQDGRAREVAFERLFEAWAAVAPHRVSRPLDWAAFEAVCEAGFDPETIAAAGERCLAISPDIRKGQVFALERWLVEQRWEAWAPPAKSAGASIPSGFVGPPEIREAFERAKGQAWVASWLGLAEWDEGRRSLVVSGYAFDRLRRESGVSALLETLKITLAQRASA